MKINKSVRRALRGVSNHTTNRIIPYNGVLYAIILLYISVFAIAHTVCAQQDITAQALKVKKHRKKDEQTFRYILFSARGFILNDHDKSHADRIIKQRKISFSVTKSGIQLNKEKHRYKAITVIPRNDKLVVNHKKYDGSLMLNTSKAVVVPKNQKPNTHKSEAQQNKGIKTAKTKSTTSKTPKKNTPKAKRSGRQKAKVEPIIMASEPIREQVRCIRVLLDEWNTQSKEWSIKSNKGFTIYDKSKSEKKEIVNSKELKINGTKDGRIIINKRIMPYQDIVITPREGYLGYKDKEYQGSFNIMNYNNRILLINSIGLENYVCSVLNTESWPGWPLEVNKVFAITCRTYAIAMVLQSKKTGQPYNVTNTNLHQTYAGVHNNQVVKEAVAQTKGIFLGHNNKPILAMFDCCCGGVIPAHIEGFDFSDAPYLKRDYACNHCKRCKIYSWSVAFEIDHLENLLNEEIEQCKYLKQVKVAKKDKAGLVKEVTLKGKHKGADILCSISGKKMYSLIKDIKSYCYTVKQKGNKVILDGRGYGHHMGICQWGAREMVRDGWPYRRILQFYYPGTTFMKVT